ncbi:putative RNA-dependent RNA polymerase 5 [Bidens hawaiensis]|uniref:putative RNA-dependent RNA polymerase 5 n=1 Tax=Bidens hawaiensis TaxID=980011 RepID=UPI00404B27C4
MTDSSTEVIIPLQPSIEQLITKICTTRTVPPPDIAARRSLSKLTEAKAIEILTKIGNSKEIREFSRFICFMAYKETATSPKEDRVLPQKRSPAVSVTDGSPLSNSKSAHFISPNSKQSVHSPGSSSNTRTILDYYSGSPNDGSGSPNSKKITPVPFSGFEDAVPNNSTYHFAESSNATNRVQKQLIFLPGCDLDDTNCSNVSRNWFDSSNTRHQLSVIKEKQILSPCSSSKVTNPSHFYDTSSAMHNGSLIPHQRSLTQCESIGGPTNSLAVSKPSCKEKQILSPCSSLKGTNPSHFFDTSSAMHNGSLIPHQRSLTQCESIGGPTNSLAISHQSLLLSELEFRKTFLVYSYVGRNTLEDVVSDEDAIEIHRMKTMTMFDFEEKIWAKYGSRFIERCDRAMHLDWDSGKTHIYHCYVDTDGAQQFKGPYLNTRRTHLQRELGDDNVLIIQFVDDQKYDMPSNHSSPIAIYRRLSGGISVGLRQYRLFAFKEGDRKKTKDDNTKKPRSSIKCFFIRKESHAPWVEKDNCILLKKTNHEARCLFMHVHMVSSMAKYVSRCALALSNSIKLRVDLASVNVERIEDIRCRDEFGFFVCDEDGKPLIHTDGTGFISEDLAILCARDFFEADGLKDDGYEFVDLLKREGESLGIIGKESCIREPPLLVQCRLFKDGYAVKGTLLVNKKLKNGTIQVRPSMIKVEKDPKLSDLTSFSSLEIVSVSRKPRKAALSKNLIALLAVGGVPKSYFLELLEIALQDAQKVSSSMRAAVRVGLNYAQMDDSATSVSMIGSGIPLDEPYLQYRLSILANEERKGLRAGRIPVNESYYLIGTADPTGTLNSDEVCVILENGQISGKVLVYRNPGLDFGDVHIMNAKYVEKLEEFVGNAKYGIFFSTKGERSVGTEIANGDFDGDTYWVCRNPQLLHYFKPSEPWKRKYSTPSAPRKKPRELSDEERENEILALLFASQKHGKEAGTAADSWQAYIDQYLTLGENDVNEKRRIKEKLLQLVDLYYDALDAPKSGKTVDIPRGLLPDKYPNYLEKYANKSYNSSSILGEIYDRAKNYQPDYALIREIWKLPCFNVEIPGPVLNLWKMRYESYRQDMSKAMQSGDESKNDSANIVMNKYKKMLYEAENFATSTRKLEDIYNEALAIYHVSYDYAIKFTDLRKCGFAWKVAGEALCSFHESKTPGRSFPFKSTVLSMLISIQNSHASMYYMSFKDLL